MLTTDASIAWKLLNGVFMIYKPPGIHFMKVRGTIIQNLCRDLNAMDVEPPSEYIAIKGSTNKEMNVIVRESYAQNPLVLGPRYVADDFRLSAANLMCRESSGLLLCGINYGAKNIYQIKESRLTRFYRLKGMMGQARDNHFSDGRIIEKSTWKHIKRHRLDHVCAAMQGAHQKKMFELCGLDIQSQAAYELAVKGPIRPADPKVPMIYTIKCVDFAPPSFTIEIVCINEDDNYLKSLITEIGLKLHSTAHCTYMQCTQYGLFNVNDALLSKHWDLQSIVNNISLCRKILTENPYMLQQEHAHLVHHATNQ